MDDKFDIVICLGPNDVNIINLMVNYTKNNIIGYRNIYIIPYDHNIKIDECITINENIFPFSIKTVAHYHGRRKRNGWYLQQLLKLYAGKVIPNILPRYLVIDADTLFLKPTTFIENNIFLFNNSSEHNDAYFIHMKKLHESLMKNEDKSGVCHHMIFDTFYINELFKLVETNNTGSFYDIFLRNVFYVNS
jgi:hypothetical protein